MGPSGIFAPGVNALTVFGCVVLTFAVAVGLTYLGGSIRGPLDFTAFYRGRQA